MIKIYGIKNCDTIRKTLKWFNDNNVSYEFIDYKKEPPTPDVAAHFLEAHNWETIINKRGTTWRKLDEQTKNAMNAQLAINLMIEQPSVIKRPIIEANGEIIVGYDELELKKLI